MRTFAASILAIRSLDDRFSTAARLGSA